MKKKIHDRGYWVAKLFYYQSLLYYFFYSLRFRSFTFFAAANPIMHLGGMLDDKKSNTDMLFPIGLFPATDIVKANDWEKSKEPLKYPVFIKPNIGLKGHHAALIESEDHLIDYMKNAGNEEILIQEFVDKQREFSILFAKNPVDNALQVSSLTEKKYPFIVGDGKRTLRQLIIDLDNPFVLKNVVLERLNEELDAIVDRDKKRIIEKIGNYSRGAKFYNLNHKITDKLAEELTRVLNDVKGIYFGRFDLKADSLENFAKGDWRAIELNGAKAEPLHIYDPNISWVRIIKDIHNHWQELTCIVKSQKRRGYKFPSLKEGLDAKKKLQALMK